MTDSQNPNIPVEAQPGSSTGLEPNIAGALAYLLGPITGVLFLVLEKRNAFVRFHAAQSVGIFVAFIALGIGLMVISTILGAIPGLGWIFAILFGLLSLLIGLAGFVLWIWLMFSAFSNKEWEFPIVAPQVRKMLASGHAA